MQGKKQRGKQVKVLQAVPESQDVVSIYLDRPEEAAFQDWKPGQYAVVRKKEGQQWSKPRPFTLSCAPGEGYLRLTVKKKGDFTQALHNIKPGDELLIDGPFGSFCADIHSRQSVVLISGGVGITPFLSVLRHFREVGAENHVVLFSAFKTRKDIIAWQELQELVQGLDLKLVLVLSREKELPKQQENIFWEQGYITRQILEKYSDLEQSSIYVCGPPAMQEKVLQELEQAGVDRSRVQIEKFGG
ncbi:MAG: FAD-binding oxidoreductase [Desulfohalobiaceae bacterium]